MRKALVILLALFAFSICIAQEKKPEVKPEPTEIVLPELDALRIQTKLKDMQLIQTELRNLQLQADKLQQDYAALQRDAQALVARAYDERKLDRKEWALDPSAGKFTRQPKAK